MSIQPSKNQANIDKLKSMNLHETKQIYSGLTVMRVVNGWIYEYWLPNPQGGKSGLGEYLIFVPST